MKSLVDRRLEVTFVHPRPLSRIVWLSVRMILDILKRNIVKILCKSADYLATEKITVIGDSHVLVFNYYGVRLQFPFKRFDVCSVNGATASGLGNPNSKTQAHRIFSEKIDELTSNDIVIVMLGEIDTGFLIWYRAQKYQASVDEIFNEVVNKYKNFLLKLKFVRKLIVISTPLPTIKDYSNVPIELLGFRREVTAS